MSYEIVVFGEAVSNSQKSHVNSKEKVGILVLGPTGSGKSSFIATVTGSPVRIGHNVTSETRRCHAWNWKYGQNQNVDLIDTPGFDDQEWTFFLRLSSSSLTTSTAFQA
ncbi:hypothetical protein CC86DRAFT_406548 [Ophiobolus disseminans]|uniref:G domain-containing protein n=1 Tax=Ophiobolus disseminans TaxID=1469910 RepID=A0A6A7A032_9PLEO|nr:hypothetical protein CC86DRAFT_406548 [Ophiobolus disseminans]